jgi:hypothetical protein
MAMLWSHGDITPADPGATSRQGAPMPSQWLISRRTRVFRPPRHLAAGHAGDPPVHVVAGEERLGRVDVAKRSARRTSSAAPPRDPFRGPGGERWAEVITVLLCWASSRSASRSRELDEVAAVVLDDREVAVDLLDDERLADELDAAGAELGEGAVGVLDRQAEVVEPLMLERRLEGDRIGLRLCGRSAQDLDLRGPVGEIGELHVAPRPFSVDVEVELLPVPAQGAGVVDDADGDVIVADSDVEPVDAS